MKLVMSSQTHDKIMHWVNKADFEVSGFGKCKYDAESGNVHILSAHLLKQEGGAAHTDIDATALSRLNYQLRQEEGELRFWWHSHVKMQAFWSGTDTATIKELGANGWCAAIVFNQKYEYKAAICGVVQNQFGITTLDLQDDLDLEILYPQPTAEEQAEWDKSFAENVTEKKFASTYLGGNSYYSGEYYGDYDRAWKRPDNVIDATKKGTALTHWAHAGPDEETAAPVAKKKGKKKHKEAWQSDMFAGYENNPLAYEARMLGMSVEKYEAILDEGDIQKIAALEAELDQAFAMAYNKGERS